MNPPKLLTRDVFRESVFERDGHKCVLCKAPGQDAHHLMERRLYPDGGYYLNNGATVCGECHLKCESTEVSVVRVAFAAGIMKIVLPPHLYADGSTTYDKWGNICLPDGRRLKGELFYDESVQKVLAPFLHLFDIRVKYPRTLHLPFSPGVMSDDKVQHDLSGLEGKEVVVTEKLDGENTSIYPGGLVHARSLEYVSRVDRDRIKALAAEVGMHLSDGTHICGENVWGEHSISYSNLEHFFYVFSAWDKGTCLSWDDTVTWALCLDLKTVPVLYQGPFDVKVLKKLWTPTYAGDELEGFVVRPSEAFKAKDFSRVCAKWVRAGHVRTQAHWTRNIKPNPFLTKKRQP